METIDVVGHLQMRFGEGTMALESTVLMARHILFLRMLQLPEQFASLSRMRGVALVGTCTLILLAPGCGRTGMGRRDGGAQDARSSRVPDAPDGATDPLSQPPSPALGDGAPESSSNLPVGNSRAADVAGTDVGVARRKRADPTPGRRQ